MKADGQTDRETGWSSFVDPLARLHGFSFKSNKCTVEIAQLVKGFARGRTCPGTL